MRISGITIYNDNTGDNDEYQWIECDNPNEKTIKFITNIVTSSPFQNRIKALRR